MDARRISSSSDSAVASDAFAARSTPVLIGSMATALDGHVGRVRDPGASEREVAEGVRTLAAVEDSLYRRHPDSYGQAVVQAVYWERQAAEDPAIRNSADDPESPAALLTSRYAAVLADASGDPASRMNADQLTQALSDIEAGEEAWSARQSRVDGGRTPTKVHRYSALSTVCGRSSADPSLRQELLTTQAYLNDRRVAEIGI